MALQLYDSSSSSAQNEDDTDNGQHHSRQPNRLQDLLKLSTSLQPNQGEGSSDKSLFKGDPLLREAIQSLSTDVADHLKVLLRTVVVTTVEVQRDAILAQILDHVSSMDVAKCFYQVEGLKAIEQFIKHPTSKVRSLACSIISECCQNNPFCQNASVDVLPSLMDVAKTDENLSTRFYAFSAISAIVRDNPLGLIKFKENQGFALLKDGLELLNPRITSKISFFVYHLSRLNDSTKDDLFEADIVSALVRAFIATHDEYSVDSLLSMANHYQGHSQVASFKCDLMLSVKERLINNEVTTPDKKLLRYFVATSQSLLDEE